MSAGIDFNADKVLAKLRGMSLKGKKTMTVSVVYTAEYAVYVHEDLTANHPNGGQAKYLEEPARRLQREMMDVVKRSVEAKNGLEEGLQRAGDLLLVASRDLVPVDTGNLRDSGKVEVVEGVA
jgi:hypothetical protein